MEIFLSENCSDYMAWKAAHLLEPNYHSLCDIGLLLQSNTSSIEHVYHDMGELFPLKLQSEQFFRVCIFQMILKQRNKLSSKYNFVHLLFEAFSNLGYRSEILDICILSYSEIVEQINNLQQWKSFILLVQGSCPTSDSELYLTKLINDIINKNTDMKTLKRNMLRMIYLKDL